MEAREAKYLAAHIYQALAEDPRVSALDLTVVVRAGKVFLIGEVESAERKQAAEEIAIEFAPALHIVNELWTPHYSRPRGPEHVP